MHVAIIITIVIMAPAYAIAMNIVLRVAMFAQWANDICHIFIGLSVTW
jgi:hypothetical protein